MINEQEASHALHELLGELQHLGATELAREIRIVIARGTIRADRQASDTPTMQMPYSAVDAYTVAVRLVLAAIDPALMIADVHAELGTLAGRDKQAIWAPDYLEGAQFELEHYQEVSRLGLSAPDVAELRARAERVLEVHNHILAENELLLTE